MFKKRYCCLLLGLLLFSSATAQELSKKQIRKQRPKFVHVGIGLNRISVRDFATSPLTYTGATFNFSLGHLAVDSNREVRYGLRFNAGGAGYKRIDGVEVQTNASIFILNLNYYRLYNIRSLSNSKWNYKLGGMFDGGLNVRLNNSLLNAGYGYEIVNTFFLSGKVTRSFVREEPKTIKIGFIKKTLKPRTINLSYQLNLPVMHNALRNGYSYIGNEAINEPILFNEYEYQAFSGLRFNSELAYTNVMHNGNRWRLAYIWDAYTADDAFNRLEVANHIVEFSLLFRLNKMNRYEK